MNNFRPPKHNAIMVTRFLTASLTMTLFLTLNVSAVDKITPEEIVAKHLQAIGSADARSAITSRLAFGICSAVFHGRSEGVVSKGRILLASTKDRNLIGMAFDSPNYPSEKAGYDGKRLTVGYVRPGIRSTLGSFLLSYDVIFKQGLLGGTLSSSWPLLNVSEKEVKLEYTGTEKIGDRRAHKIRYLPRKGSDLQITLFFDTETFQHVRTQYDRVIGARIGGGVDSSASQRETRYKMVEDFSDYKREGKLVLPHTYGLELEIQNSNGTTSTKWTSNLNQFSFNQPIEDVGFNVGAN